MVLFRWRFFDLLMHYSSLPSGTHTYNDTDKYNIHTVHVHTGEYRTVKRVGVRYTMTQELSVAFFFTCIPFSN